MPLLYDALTLFCNESIGTSTTFIVAVIYLFVWMIAGVLLMFSNGWWLAFSVATTAITFLIVFLIQHAQNRDTKAIQIKLDELLRAVDGARTHLVRLEDYSDEELDVLQNQFQGLREEQAPLVAEEMRAAREDAFAGKNSGRA